MIYILWKGEYYILVSVNRGFSNLYMRRDSVDTGKSVSTVDLINGLKATDIPSIIFYNGEEYEGAYIKKSSKSGRYRTQNIEIPTDVGPTDEMKEQIWLISNLADAKRKKSAILKWARNYDVMSEELRNKYCDKFIWDRKMHLAFPSSMSGDIYYLMKTCELHIYKKSDIIVHVVYYAKGDRSVANNTIRLLLFIAAKSDLNVYFTSSSGSKKYDMEQKSVWTDGGTIQGYGKSMVNSRNDVLRIMEQIDEDLHEDSLFETKLSKVLNPFTCTCVISENKWYGKKINPEQSLFCTLANSAIEPSLWLSKKAKFETDMGFTYGYSPTENYVFIFYRKTDYHFEDNTSSEMIQYATSCFDLSTTKIFVYGDIRGVSESNVQTIDPYTLFGCEGEMNKFLFWKMVQEVLIGNGKTVKVLGPRSGSVDVAAMFGLDVYTWHQFKLQKGDVCGGLRLLLSAPTLLNVFYWSGKVYKSMGAFNTSQFDPNILKTGNDLVIELKLIDISKTEIFKQGLVRIDPKKSLNERSYKIFEQGVSAESWGVDGNLGNVLDTKEDSYTNSSDIKLKLVELHITTRRTGSASTELDEFLKNVLVAAGGHMSDLQFQIEKKRVSITKAVGNVFVYRFYHKNE